MQRSNLVNTLSFSVYQNTSHRERAMFFEGAIFSEQHQLYRNEGSHLKQLLFRRKIFFRIFNCLEQLLLSKNYFFVANTFSNQLEDKYFLKINTFFSTATVSKELFSRINKHSEYVLFWSRSFFRTGTSSEEKLF